LDLLQGWEVLEPPRSPSLLPITTPRETHGDPQAQHPGHISHGHWAVSTATCPSHRPVSRMDPSPGSLVILLCLQFIRFSVGCINQSWVLFSHTRERGRHAGNRYKIHGGLNMAGRGCITPTPYLFLLCIFFS
jgi:hypothetical protein